MSGAQISQTLPTSSSPGFQGLFARLPARRGGFALMFLDVLAGPDLADHLRHVAAHRRGQHLHGLEDAVGVDEEAAPDIHAVVLVINPVGLADAPPGSESMG